ncbi:MAG TPA: hypothetical protein VNO30_30950 [Kofleriaceae bacterium]|nr:hypothetical protein [Kofleriaceae bacterium]
MSAETQTQTRTPMEPLTCYAAIRDEALRAELTRSLGQLGWRVVARPTGFHLVQELADVILDPARAVWPPIGLLVVDEPSPGCRGSSIARGLRELGINAPVTVIAPPEVAPAEAPEERIYVVEPWLAAVAVPVIARHHQPAAASTGGAAAA